MWIESHQELAAHPKTKRLARRLGVSLPTAIGHLHLLWWWALDYADDGDLTKFVAEDIADAMLWEANADELVDALITCGIGGEQGFLDRSEDGRLMIHDWMDYAGRLVDQREKDKERVRQWRKSRNATPTVTASNADVTDNVPVASDVTVPTVPNQPNRTEPNHVAAPVAPRTRKGSPPSVKAEESEAPSDKERRAALFDAFIRGQGWDAGRLSTNDRGQINYAIKTLEPAHPTTEEIDLAYARYPKVMRDCLMTPPAVAKHFSTLIAGGRDSPTNGTNGTFLGKHGMSGPLIDDDGQMIHQPPPTPPSTERPKPRTPEEAAAQYERLSSIGGPWRGHDA